MALPARTAVLLTLAISISTASAQVIAPGQPVDVGAASSAASPVMSLAPPSAATDSVAALGLVRANEPITTNALLGYVNSVPVFADDLLFPMDDKMQSLAKTAATLAEFKTKARVLIRNELSQRESEILLASSAERLMTDEDKKRIEIFLNTVSHDLISAHGGSSSAAEAYLRNTRHISIDQYMADQRREVIKEIYFQKYLKPKIAVTRDMLMEAYARDPKRWEIPAQVDLFTITLPVSRWLHTRDAKGEIGPVIEKPTPEEIKTAEASAMSTAKEIVAKARTGYDFARLVEDSESRDLARTRGGHSGTINRHSMVNTALEDYVFSLKANAIGEPQLIHDADFNNSIVVIVKLGEKKTEAHTKSFEEAAPELSQELQTQQLQDLEEREMAKMAEGAPIERVEQTVSMAVDAAVSRYAMK